MSLPLTRNLSVFVVFVAAALVLIKITHHSPNGDFNNHETKFFDHKNVTEADAGEEKSTRAPQASSLKDESFFKHSTAATSRSHTNISRIAYLLTVDVNSPRTRRSQAILERVGFQVQLHIADIMDDKVLSNKFAQVAVYRKIISDDIRPWGYIFEDDIVLVGTSHNHIENETIDFSVERYIFEDDIVLVGTSHNHIENETIDFSVERDLVGPSGSEASNLYFAYLGICRENKDACVEHCCGRCAHAYGISKVGAKLLMEFGDKFQKQYVTHDANRYQDWMTDLWCTSLGGFPVLFGNKQSYQDSSHFGAFIQDRKTFKSIIMG